MSESISLSETVVVEIPGNRSEGDWAKELTSVDAKASDGKGYEGSWLSVGASADLEPGAIYLRALFTSSRKRGKELKNAKIMCVLPGSLGTYEVDASDRDRGWATELRKNARTWLALSREERVKKALKAILESRTSGAAEKRAKLAAMPETAPEPSDCQAIRAGLPEVLERVLGLAEGETQNMNVGAGRCIYGLTREGGADKATADSMQMIADIQARADRDLAEARAKLVAGVAADEARIAAVQDALDTLFPSPKEAAAATVEQAIADAWAIIQAVPEKDRKKVMTGLKALAAPPKATVPAESPATPETQS